MNFQFFPSCFRRLRLGLWGWEPEPFQFFPSCFIIDVPALTGLEAVELSILSQLLPEYDAADQLDDEPDYFQFFPSCLGMRVRVTFPDGREEAFNSFPVASRA